MRLAISQSARIDEPIAVQRLIEELSVDTSAQPAIQALAQQLVSTVRTRRVSVINAVLQEYPLSSPEGLALMALAEALLRIPDVPSANRLIVEKIAQGDWRTHLSRSPSFFANAITWGLHLISRRNSASPLIRPAITRAMHTLGQHFVIGETIQAALDNASHNEARGDRYSYDMLGEAALTARDAALYFASYERAIHATGSASNGRGVEDGPGVSVKLSALHPRYAYPQRRRVMAELLPRLQSLLLLAAQYQIGLNIDAEESDQLDMSLDLLEALAFDPALSGFDGLGIAVQSYQKRCPDVIDFLIDLARRSGRKLMVRLVKGAYWDTEIKRAQIDGLGYPVFTRKGYTDLCYLACAKKLLAAADVIYPQFATHNAHTVASIYTWAQQLGVKHYEFQRLYGMGEALYDQFPHPCRIYAPVGMHETLLPYLVRRLLENSANSSFVHQIHRADITALIADPLSQAKAKRGAPHPGIPKPCALYGAARRNSSGLDLNDAAVWRETAKAFDSLRDKQWQAGPLIVGPITAKHEQVILNPANRREKVGSVMEASMADVESALRAAASETNWPSTTPQLRANILQRAADLLESHRIELMSLAIREAGKTWPNAVSEVREAVDFLRYYAAQSHTSSNGIALGPVACISPWNFPLAIFIGQISAALAVGNVVLAKSAEQTPLIAHRAVQLLHAAGIPRAALQLLPGRGETIGAALVADARIKGVVFTGSTEVAQSINRTLSQRAVAEAIEIPLIAETGGQNAMIVDSSALTEQVVRDVLLSAFDSAGQRCSALRVLCLQTEIADQTLAMLKGAMQELRVGNPSELETDVGPVIDEEAQQKLQDYLVGSGFPTWSIDLAVEPGTFIAPSLIEIDSLSQLHGEVFGPILHVLRYRRDELPLLVDEINATGYGLTLGIHSRINETIDFITSKAHVGNMYVNRTMIGAVVGVQPFGGEGKSGTGPKAGGPLYLTRLQRHAVPTLDAPIKMGSAPPEFDALLAWVRKNHSTHITKLIEGYARDSLLNASFQLVGPTGEENSLTFSARGTVLCVAESSEHLLNQLAAVLATGNRAVVPAQYAKTIPTAWRAEIQAVAQAAIATEHFQIALVDASQRDIYLALLSSREDVVIPVIETTSDQPIPTWRLLVERALCVNTAALGGNAALICLTDP